MSDNNQTIFRKGSTTYYYSSLFFTGQTKKDVFTLYAYVRTIDDLVDQSNPRKSEFDRLWRETKCAWKGEEVENPIVSGFVSLAKRHEFEWAWIDSFWDSMRSDLTKKHYRNYAELERYMYGSAEVIGLMMSKILNLHSDALAPASLQGRAMQYLNFIRDVVEDEQLGRNYLGYTAKQRNDPVLWSHFLRTHIDRYKKLQNKAEEGYRFIPRKYLVPIKTAAQMYLWTSDQITKNPSVVWEKKVKPDKWRVLTQIINNYLKP